MKTNYINRYIVLGLANTLFGYVVFIILYSLLQKQLEMSIIFILSAAISVSESFYVQKKYVWRSSENWTREARRFALTFVIVFFINLGALSVASRFTNLDLRWVQLPILVLISIGLFFTHKNWTFESTDQRSS
jgi:putative flippase GtrA